MANAGVVDFSSKPIKTLLISADPSKMPDDQKMYAIMKISNFGN